MQEDPSKHWQAPRIAWTVGALALAGTLAALAEPGSRRAAAFLLVLAGGFLAPIAQSVHKRLSGKLLLIAALLLIAVGCVCALAPAPSVPATDQEHIAACRRKHKLPPTQLRGADSHEACSWPPPVGADSDGYSVVKVTFYSTDKPEADDESHIWVFDSQCSKIKVEWWVGAQSNDHVDTTQTYQAGQIVNIDDDAAVLPPERMDLEVTRDPNALIVLSPSKIDPRQVECA